MMPALSTDLPESSYPIRVDLFTVSGEVVHRIDIDGPGVATVPGLAKVHGPIGVKITYGDGNVSVHAPPGVESYATP